VSVTVDFSGTSGFDDSNSSTLTPSMPPPVVERTTPATDDGSTRTPTGWSSPSDCFSSASCCADRSATEANDR